MKHATRSSRSGSMDSSGSSIPDDTAGFPSEERSAATSARRSITASEKEQSKCCAPLACRDHHVNVMPRSPSVLWIPLLAFCALAGTGMAVILLTARSDREDAQKAAIAHATEAGRWFATQLDRAVTPVFSLAQFMTEIEDFDRLPDEIGSAYESGALDFLPEPTQDGIPTHRNTSGSSLRSPTVVERFDRIASRIKANANMPGILVNLQVAAHGVLALSYPLNNTEDFPEGAYLDSSTIIGFDLLTAPNRRVGAEATIRAKNSIVIVGPVALHQCRAGAGNICDPVVDQAFIARLNVPSERHEVLLSDGTVQKSWGFAAGIINWFALVQESGLYEEFAANGREFRLVNWQPNCGASGLGCSQLDEKELAKTPGFDRMGPSWLTATVKLDNRTMNDWEMNVGYPDPTTPWFPAATAAVFLISFAMAVLVYFLLHQKQLLLTMEDQRKALELLKKKRAMDKKLKEAYAMIENQKKTKGNVGLVSSMRKIGRLEEELADVESDMEGLERYVEEHKTALKSNSNCKKKSHHHRQTEEANQDLDRSVDPCARSTASRSTCASSGTDLDSSGDAKTSAEHRNKLDGNDDKQESVTRTFLHIEWSSRWNQHGVRSSRAMHSIYF